MNWGSAIRYDLEQRTGLDPTKLEDAQYIVAHAASFDPAEVSMAQANIDAENEEVS